MDMANFKVGSKAQTGPKPAEKIASAPKTSFAETLAAQSGEAKAPAPTTARAESRPDPRADQLMDMLAQQLVTTTRSIAKKAKLQKEKAKGGMEGD